jgi:glucose-1-phosphate thymidylyltransferase
MLDYILDAVAPIEGVDEVIVVTNSKFYSQFKEWADASPYRFGGNPITVLDDRTTNDANKRGAVGDIHYVLAQKRIS